VLLEETVHAVKGFIQNRDISQVNQPHMALSKFGRKATAMDEENVLLME
jgi:hypothetical protein